jgi:predicted ATPase
MLSVRLQNVRSLLDTSELTLKPLTILVGKNNSGKSTLTRFFPLLKQSLQAPANAPLLWYGELVDFGTIRDVISRFSKDDNKIRLDVVVSGPSFADILFPVRNSFRRGVFDHISAVSYGSVLEEKDNKTVLSAFHLRLDDDIAVITVSDDGAVLSATVNDVDYSTLLPENSVKIDTSSFVPNILSAITAGGQSLRWIITRGTTGFDRVSEEIRKIYRQNLHGRFETDTLNRLVRGIRYAPRDEFVSLLKASNNEYSSWNDFTYKLGLDSKYWKDELKNLQRLYFLRDLPEFMQQLHRALSAIFLDVGYIAPTRATGERYYRIRELAIDQIDPRGENLAMFLNSLSPSERRRFTEWTETFLGYSVSTHGSEGHISIMLREQGAEGLYNLADVGYGLSQVLPVAAQIWAQTRTSQRSTPISILAIEQPELHLHPAFQAKLADALVGAISAPSPGDRPKGGTILVVETHSQQLISRIGQLIAGGKLDANDVAIYVFEKPEPDGPTTVEAAWFDDDGDLRHWPFGFFSAETEPVV